MLRCISGFEIVRTWRSENANSDKKGTEKHLGRLGQHGVLPMYPPMVYIKASSHLTSILPSSYPTLCPSLHSHFLQNISVPPNCSVPALYFPDPCI